MTRKATFGAVVFSILLITTGLSGAVGVTSIDGGAADTPSAPLAQETTRGDGAANESANLTLADQQTNGSAVVVERANLSSGGYVVVFTQNGTVLGNTSYLEPGAHENVTVTLNATIGSSQVLIATPHLDTDDDREFDFNATRAQEVGAVNATDRPYLQSNGLPVSAVAFVTVENETSRRTTAASRAAPTG